VYPEDPLSHNWLAMRIANRGVRNRLPSLGGLVIDLGCGKRPFEHDILKHAREYVGVDWGNTLHGTHADVLADLNKPLPLRDGMADHIVSFEVLEHLAEPRVMLGEAFRVLRPGGQLTVSVPFQWWVHEAPWDYYRYTCHGLEYMLGKAGFVDVKVTPTSGFWVMWVLKLNYRMTQAVRGPRALRTLLRAALVPFWWVDQHVAAALDRAFPDYRETVGYFVTAAKP